MSQIFHESNSYRLKWIQNSELTKKKQTNTLDNVSNIRSLQTRNITFRV